MTPEPGNVKHGDVPTASTQRIQLRVVECVFTMSDSHCFKVAHMMLVKGQVREFLRHLPLALMQTFNRHPRMRAKQIKNEFVTAEIHPHLMLEDITEHDLLQVKKIDADGMADAHWRDYVQEQVDAPLDRYDQFPFVLHVWADKPTDRVRLFLFADHYLSDGIYGSTILNDILTFASSLSLAPSSTTSSALQELPVRGSFYNILLDPHPFSSPILRLMMAVAAKMVLTHSPIFVPLITLRPGQQHFSIPPPHNSSTMLFADDAKENLNKLVARCKEEDTSAFGAMAAAVMVGYAVVTGSSEANPLKMRLYVNINMRERVLVPIEPETVGCCASATPLESLSKERIDITARRFWDLARDAKREITGNAQKFVRLALPMVLLDQHLN